MATEKNLPIIGSTEYVEIFGIKNVPAKIDTGADSSSIWASNIDMEKDGTLVFSLFGEKSPLYTGEKIRTKEYRAKIVRSSHGDEQVRYQIMQLVKIGKKNIEATFTLANRARNYFPILIGKNALSGEFIIDVSKSSVDMVKKPKTTLNSELKNNPIKFHQKYIKKGAK